MNTMSSDDWVITPYILLFFEHFGAGGEAGGIVEQCAHFGIVFDARTHTHTHMMLVKSSSENRYGIAWSITLFLASVDADVLQGMFY